jgi:choline kinase
LTDPGTAGGALPPKVIILAAGRPYRGNLPAILSGVTEGARVLDWLVDAFADIGTECHLVAGYRFEEVTRRYPDLAMSLNSDWRDSGPAESLFAAPLDTDRDIYVCYGDVVVRRDTVAKLAAAEGDIVLAVDCDWLTRYQDRTARDRATAEKVLLTDDAVAAVGTGVETDAAAGEFAGVARFRPRAVTALRALRENARADYRRSSFPDLLSALIADGFAVRTVDVAGDWAELNAPADLAHFVLGTKAETLARLRPLVSRSVIGEQATVTLGAWRTDRAPCLDAVAATFGDRRLVVRSSSLTEDSWEASRAGAYLSLLDIDGSDMAAVESAIDAVAASFDDGNDAHQILIQEMVGDVAASGVLFTRTLNFGAPYLTINYDATTSSTDSVTGGGGRHLETVYVRRGASLPVTAPKALAGLLPAVEELEQLVAHDSLDIEFIIDGSGTVHIVQLRPIAVDHSRWRGSDEDIGKLLSGGLELYRQKQNPGPFVFGKHAPFSNMTDWNPAEIIGTRPRALATSLYRYLVTDEIWARQRCEYGYRDVRPQPLMALFAGRPYIDVRASFNSFIPSGLDDGFARRLADYYLGRLQAEPALHDKVEFDILLTCRTFDFETRAAALAEAGFDASEIDTLGTRLRQLTESGVARVGGDLAQVETLNRRFETISVAPLPDLTRAFGLLEDAQRYGTLPFSHLARGAFVAVALLRSAVGAELIPQEEFDRFLASIETVAKRFQRDVAAVASGAKTMDTLIADYGHLRPGTYEITSSSYGAQPNRYLAPLVANADRAHETPGFDWSGEAKSRLDAALQEHGFGFDSDALMAFARAAIEGREWAKFCFSRNISAALDAIAAFGGTVGLDRETLSHLALDELRTADASVSPVDKGAWLQERARGNAELHVLAQGIELPPLIGTAADFDAFALPDDHPNFVSTGTLTAKTAVLPRDENRGVDFAGRIVLIPQADPGYDWLFGHGIGGLITAYGGANSHMAIRAAEFGLSAAIGIGEKRFERLANAEIICLDCRHGRIEVVQ